MPQRDVDATLGVCFRSVSVPRGGRPPRHVGGCTFVVVAICLLCEGRHAYRPRVAAAQFPRCASCLVLSQRGHSLSSFGLRAVELVRRYPGMGHTCSPPLGPCARLARARGRPAPRRRGEARSAPPGGTMRRSPTLEVARHRSVQRRRFWATRALPPHAARRARCTLPRSCFNVVVRSRGLSWVPSHRQSHLHGIPS